MTIYDELADQIFAEVSAVLGPLHSTHLDRKLDAGDIHDAVILATDTPGGEPDRAALLIAAAPQLLEALKWIICFIDEHQEWWGADDPDMAEACWLEAARTAIKAATDQEG